MGAVTTYLALTLALGGGAGKPACQVLSIADVAQAAGAAVTIDPSQSGPDGEGRDFCAWKTPDGHFVILGIEAKGSPGDAKAAYAATLVTAFGNGPAAQPITGLGDEAQYRDYVGGLKGGVVVVRHGPVVLTVEGPMSRDKITALTRLVLARSI